MCNTFSTMNAYEKQRAWQSPEEMCQESMHDYNHLKGKIVVAKLGGSTLEHQRMVIHDLIWLQKLGIHSVLVHGGGPSINTMLETLHIPIHFEQGIRITDAQTLEVVCMVLRGQINDKHVLNRGAPVEESSRVRFQYHPGDNPDLPAGTYDVAFTAFAKGWHKGDFVEAFEVHGTVDTRTDQQL